METVMAMISFGVFILSGYWSLFLWWRILNTEHIDDSEQIFDCVVISLLVAGIAGKIAAIVVRLPSVAWDPRNLLTLENTGGFVESVAIVTLLLTFELLVTRFHDQVGELVDYAVIPISLFLSLNALGNFLRNFIILLNPATQTLSWWVHFRLDALLGGLFFALIVFLLLKIERSYRTYLWYRYRRTSAQSGFVLAAFLIFYGSFQSLLFILNWSVGRVPFVLSEQVLSLLVIVGGFVILYVRSGRLTFYR